MFHKTGLVVVQVRREVIRIINRAPFQHEPEAKCFFEDVDQLLSPLSSHADESLFRNPGMIAFIVNLRTLTVGDRHNADEHRIEPVA